MWRERIFKWQPSKLLWIWIFGAVIKVRKTEKNITSVACYEVVWSHKLVLLNEKRSYTAASIALVNGCIACICSCNPGQNYLRKFSPSRPLSYATKLFPKRRLCGKKTPSPNPMLLPTNAQGSGFFLNTQQHCFQGKGEREEPVQVRCLEKCCPSIQFSQQFCPRLWLLLIYILDVG